jgi:NitT/TauT family transport system substrate-binding protein
VTAGRPAADRRAAHLSVMGVDTASRPLDTRPYARASLVAARERRSPLYAPHPESWSRREFLAELTLAGTAGLLGWYSRRAAAELPPETTKIRLVREPAICLAPQYLAEELLRLEGFTDVEYVEATVGPPLLLIEKGQADLTQGAARALVYEMDGHPSLVAVAGVHAGCFELFGNDTVHAVRDLKGKTVAVGALGGADHVLLSSMLAYIGMNPQRDVNWLAEKLGDAMRYFIEGKADAFMGFAPQPQELRAMRVGHVIVNTAQDRPWSQYFCCMLVANREFVAQYPIATKRSLRAFLKAADICAQDPERAARFLVAKGYEPRYEIAIEVLQSLPYRRWRELDPEDTLRFHALRLHEVGMIKTSPQQIIAQGTDWRFLTELKRELKG